MEKLLVTGGCGLLGRRIIQEAQAYECYAVGLEDSLDVECNYSRLDITDKKRTGDMIKKITPDFVIHTAALTDVDYCETDKDRVWKVNVEGTKNIAEGCETVMAKMIYISTDFVFDGTKGNYNENDQTNPINYYGATKLEGEMALDKFDINYAIARTSVLYGWHPSKLNFVTWVINSLSAGKRLNIVTDQYTSPTLSDNLVKMLFALRNRTGVYHTAGIERMDRYNFALEIAKTYDLDESLINPITSEGLKQKAKRPMDSSLDVSKAISDLNVNILNITQGLNKMKKNR